MNSSPFKEFCMQVILFIVLGIATVQFHPAVAIIIGIVIVLYITRIWSLKSANAFTSNKKEFLKELFHSRKRDKPDQNSAKSKLEQADAETERKNRLEKHLKSEKVYTLKQIDSLPMADAIFYITLHNRRMGRNDAEFHIDPFELFPDEPREVIQAWISHARDLESGGYWVGDALVESVNKRGDDEARERARQNYNNVRNNFINSNPGYSEKTYEHAIHLGASRAIH